MLQKSIGAPRVPLFVLVLSLLLGGCDGGLFGTGDPTVDNASTVDASDVGGDASTGGAAGGDADGDIDGVDTADEQGDTAASPPPSSSPVSLNNAVVSTSRDDAVVQLFNYTGTDLVIDPLLADNTVVAPATVSDALTVPADINRIDIRSTEDQTVVAFEPVTLAQGSATGILVRSLDQTVNGDATSFVIRSQAGSESTAQVRLILAGPLEAASDTGDTRLVPAGDSPAGAEVLLPSLSFDNPVGEYVAASSGDYTVQSAFFDVRDITLQAGLSYTLVLNPDADEEALQVLLDSDIDR